jgi:hypothetical protein
MSKAVWDAHRNKLFCDICMDEVNLNNREGGCLSRKGYQNLENRFAEKIGDRLVMKQFKNKWDALKRITWDGIAKCNRARLGS